MAERGNPRKGETEKIAPIALDETDERSLEAVRAAMWLRDPNDAAVQCIRLTAAAVAKQPSLFKRFSREAEGTWSEGHKRVFRLLPAERETLDALAETFGATNRAEAMRLVIRIGEHLAVKAAESK